MEWFMFVVLTFVRLANRIEKGETLFAAEALEFAQWTGMVAMLELYIAQCGNAMVRDGDDGYHIPSVLARYNFLAKRASETPYVLNAWHIKDGPETVLMAMLSNGNMVELFRYFADEYDFYAMDFHGHTQEEAGKIFRNAANNKWGIHPMDERAAVPMRVSAKLLKQTVYQDTAELSF